MSDLHDWLEDARIERMFLERRPSAQTGLIEDEYAEDEPEDEEVEELKA